MISARKIAVLLGVALSVSLASAAELSMDALQGQWTYTHILMEDGGRKISVNMPAEFRADGTVIFYSAQQPEAETSRGTFVIQGDTVLYSDGKGDQPWRLISIDDENLVVDHRGARMFFER